MTISENPDVEAWIGGVSFVQTTETIYRNNAIWAEYEPILAEIERLQLRLEELTTPAPAATDSEESLGGEPGPLAAPLGPVGEESLGEARVKDADLSALEARLRELQAEADAVAARYADDVEVWHFRALDPETEIQVFIAEVAPDGIPDEPRPLGTGSSPQKRAAWKRRYEAWLAEMARIGLEVNLRSVNRACLKVIVAGEEMPPPSVEGLRALMERPYGKRHFAQLVAAVERVTTQEVEFPAPHRSGS